MHSGSDLPLVARSMAMSDALIVISEKGFGVAGVTDDGGKLVGIITDGDLRRHMSADLLFLTASDVMTTSPKTIGPDALAQEAVRVMNTDQPKVMCLFVTDEDQTQPLGLIHIHDCLRAGLG